jgi:hypothetical protein
MQELKSSDGGSFIYKTDTDCQHSMNAPASVLEDSRDDKPLVLSFQ